MRRLLALSLLLLSLGTPCAMGQGRCTGFKWDVSKELTLFDGAGQAIAAGNNSAAAPTIVADRLYQLQLQPQSGVVFPLAPGKTTAAEATYAGVAILQLPTAGHYRVAVDAPLWIDVAGDGKLAAVTDFQGQQNCDGPHKIVEFDLAGARRYYVQLSGSAKMSIRLTITQTPPRTL